MLQHTVEKDLQILNLLGKEVVSKEVIIHWNRDIDQEVDQILRENSVHDFVHIHPVSRWMFKCWEDDRMAKIIDYFIEEKNFKVIITGSSIKRELDQIDRIISLCKTKPINLSGQLTLKHLASLSSKSKLFFGVDTAPMHIAAATNTPVLAIFGASFPIQWGPWNNSSNKQLFLNINGTQMNGKHCMVSNMNHDFFYEGLVKKSKGMVLIDYDKVRSALDSIL
jgi:heptosyltransferase-3